MNNNNLICIVLGISIVVWLVCMGQKKDGFQRTCMATEECHFERTPVDFAFKKLGVAPNVPFYTRYIGGGSAGWESNPHMGTNFSRDRGSPLDMARGDFYSDERKLWDPHPPMGGLWKQFNHDFSGCGDAKVDISINDIKTRSNLAAVGDLTMHRELNNVHSDLHGPRTGVSYTEHGLLMKDPHTEYEIPYYGREWHQDRLGD